MEAQDKIEAVWYPASTYVWCKGESKVLGRHPIFVSSPVRFRFAPSRFTELLCPHRSCSLHEQPTRYSEEEIGFEDGYVPGTLCSQTEIKR